MESIALVATAVFFCAAIIYGAYELGGFGHSKS